MDGAGPRGGRAESQHALTNSFDLTSASGKMLLSDALQSDRRASARGTMQSPSRFRQLGGEAQGHLLAPLPASISGTTNFQAGSAGLGPSLRGGGLPMGSSKLGSEQRTLSMNAAILSALASQMQMGSDSAGGVGGGVGGFESISSMAGDPLGHGRNMGRLTRGVSGGASVFAPALEEAAEDTMMLDPATLFGGNGDIGGSAMLGANGDIGASGFLRGTSALSQAGLAPRRLAASPSLPTGMGKPALSGGLPRPFSPIVPAPNSIDRAAESAAGGGFPYAGLGRGPGGGMAGLSGRLGGNTASPNVEMQAAAAARAAAAAAQQHLERTSSAPPLGELGALLTSQASDASELELMYRTLYEQPSPEPSPTGARKHRTQKVSGAGGGFGAGSSLAGSTASSPEHEGKGLPTRLHRMGSAGAAGLFASQAASSPGLAHGLPGASLMPPPGAPHSLLMQKQEAQLGQALLGHVGSQLRGPLDQLRERTKLSRTSSCPPLSEIELEQARLAASANAGIAMGASAEGDLLEGLKVGGEGGRRKRARGTAATALAAAAAASAGAAGGDAALHMKTEMGDLDVDQALMGLGAEAGLASPTNAGGAPGARAALGTRLFGEPRAAPAPPAEPVKDYIHVRARRGQATDSHSLAERMRREKISERMKVLQSLVPTCSKVTGKAMMLDEIINYVRSLQLQVQLLSSKLAALSQQEHAAAGASVLADPGVPPGDQSGGLDAMALGEGSESFSALLRNDGDLGGAELLAGEEGAEGGMEGGLPALSGSVQSTAGGADGARPGGVLDEGAESLDPQHLRRMREPSASPSLDQSMGSALEGSRPGSLREDFTQGVAELLMQQQQNQQKGPAANGTAPAGMPAVKAEAVEGEMEAEGMSDAQGHMEGLHLGGGGDAPGDPLP